MNTPIASESLPDWKESLTTTKALFGVGVFLALLIGLFFERVDAMAAIWMKEANYSHGFLIIPISAFLAYQRLKTLKALLQPECVLGCVTMAVGGLILLATSIVRVMIVDYLALALILRGAAVTIGGRAWASAFTFPIFFLFFMFPLPVTWTNFTSVWLQDWVSWVSGRVLEQFFVCHQQGNMIVVAGAAEPLFVAQECSGLRQLVSFVALATLVGYIGRKGVLFGILMMLAAVPVAIISNVLRVLLMAVAIRYFGSQSMSGWLHDVPALLTLPIGLLLFFFLYKCIGDFFPSKAIAVEGAK